MKDFLENIEEWESNKQEYAMARVIKTWGSSPRAIGSVLFVNEDLEMIGSVSGGCVEGDVAKACQEVIAQGKTKHLHYGVSNEEAWTVGLSCGGKLEVFLQDAFRKQEAIWKELKSRLEQNLPSILVSSIEEETNRNTLILDYGHSIGDDLSKEIQDKASECYQKRKNELIETEEGSYFVQVFPRKSQLFIVGAVHLAADLVRLAKMFDFECIVIDPRAAFAQKTQFLIAPDKIIEAYPSEVFDQYSLDAYSYAVLLSHDPKIDDNALEVLLNSKVAYIGALGSRKTHIKRLTRLCDLGFNLDQRERIYAPIGMSIKAKSPKEIALSIISQIIGVKNGSV